MQKNFTATCIKTWNCTGATSGIEKIQVTQFSRASIQPCHQTTSRNLHHFTKSHRTAHKHAPAPRPTHLFTIKNFIKNLIWHSLARPRNLACTHPHTHTPVLAIPQVEACQASCYTTWFPSTSKTTVGLFVLFLCDRILHSCSRLIQPRIRHLQVLLVSRGACSD